MTHARALFTDSDNHQGQDSSQVARAWQGCPSRQRAPQRGSSCLNTLWGLVFSGFRSRTTFSINPMTHARALFTDSDNHQGLALVGQTITAVMAQHVGVHREREAWQGCPSRQRAPQRGSSCLNTLWGLVFSGFRSRTTFSINPMTHARALFTDSDNHQGLALVGQTITAVMAFSRAPNGGASILIAWIG